MKVKEDSEKASLKLKKKTKQNKKNTKIMAPGSINSWQVEGGKVEAVTDFLFLGSKITVEDDCSCEIG